MIVGVAVVMIGGLVVCHDSGCDCDRDRWAGSVS